MPVRPSAVTNRCCPGRRARIIAALGIEGAAHGEASVTVRQVTSHPHASARNAVSPARAGPGRRWIGRLILGLLGLVLALATAEVALRVLGPRVPALGSLTSIATFQTYHPVYGFFHRPGAAGWIHTPEFTSFVQINSRGLREREIEPARPPGTRIGRTWRAPPPPSASSSRRPSDWPVSPGTPRTASGAWPPS